MPSQLTDYRKISLALIATVLNEQNNILDFLESYRKQSLLAQEFIIVDAGSTDGTDVMIEDFSQKNPHLKIRLFRKKSNRSQARNFAAKQTKAQYLALTDAGSQLDRFWLEELTKELVKSGKKVVGGHFRGNSQTRFEAAVVPYFLQLTKNLNAKNFMPTTRSLLIERKLWESVGGLNEKLELSEDYQLMLRLKQQKIEFAFARNALVFWEPPHTWIAFLKKIAAFAKSDLEAGIVRPKVVLIFLRYFLFMILFLSLPPIYFFSLFLLYLLWSIAKNFHNCRESWYFLPLLQISTDFTIMLATLWAVPSFRLRAS